MNLHMPITKKRIKNHFHYAWWQYVLLIALVAFGCNLLYTTTRYRSPENLKVEWYGEAAVIPDSPKTTDDLMAMLHQTIFSDMEEVTFTPVGYDETYGEMQLMVWVSAGQGDVYMLMADRFKGLAQGGALLDLQPYIDNGTLDVTGVDLKGGYVADSETGVKCLAGIPTDSLKGLEQYGIIPGGEVIGVLANGGNVDNAVKLIAYLLAEMK